MGAWVEKPEMRGVQEHPITIPACAIEAVADDWCGKAQGVGRVHPELMGTTGERGERDPGVFPIHSDFFPDGDAHLALHCIVNLLGTVVRVKSEGEVDFTAVFCKNPLYHGCVAFVHLAVGKAAGKCTMGDSGHGKDHQPGGVHVQSVHRRLANHGGEEAA